MRGEPRRLVPCLVYAALCGSVVAGMGNPVVVEVSRELGIPLETAQWTLTLTLVVGAVCTPIAARVGDGRLRKQVLVAALATVALGSLVGIVWHSVAGLLLGRALQGLGYALVALTVGIARDHLEGPRLARTLALLSTSLAVGVGLANPLVGVAVALWDYRGGFVLALLVAGSAAWWAARALPRPPTDLPPVGQDVRGALLLSGGLTALLVAIARGNTWGWLATPSLLLFGAAAVLLLGWVWVELREPLALVDVRLAVSPGINGVNLAALLIGFSVFGGTSAAILVVMGDPASDIGLGRSVLVTGLLMMPTAAANLLGPALFRQISTRWGERFALPVGALGCAAAYLVLARAHHSEWHIGVVMACMGFGIGISYAAMPVLIVARAPRHRTASATGVSQVLRLVGGALGSAVTMAVLMAGVDPARRVTTEAGFVAASLLCAAVALVAVPASFLLVRPVGGRPAEDEPEPPGVPG